MHNSNEDIFYQSAYLWDELIQYDYLLTYGHKNKLYEIKLTFSHEDFPHLAGFQYLKDITLFVFIIKTNTIKESKREYICCSTFTQRERDYSVNQKSRAIIKKEIIHSSTGTSTILLNKVSGQNNKKSLTRLS